MLEVVLRGIAEHGTALNIEDADFVEADWESAQTMHDKLVLFISTCNEEWQKLAQEALDTAREAIKISGYELSK